VIRVLSEFFFDPGARIATLQADGGGNATSREASGSVNKWLTDWNTMLSLVADRQMQSPSATNDTLFVLSPDTIEIATLHGMKSVPLASDGLTENRELQWDLGLKVLDWHANGSVVDINPTNAVIP